MRPGPTDVVSHSRPPGAPRVEYAGRDDPGPPHVRLSETTSAVMDGLDADLASRLGGAPSVESAAQSLAGLVFETFSDTAVLARVFLTVPFGRLPGADQYFVRRLVGARDPRGLKPQTPVLSLIGTRGLHPRWNDRYDSRGHLGIPLTSAETVESIPMIARLLKELGATLEWASDLDTAIVTAALGPVAGAFFVEDAATGLDPQGRTIIGAQEFVAEYGVRTVFGFGGAYPVGRSFLAVVVFAREAVERQHADRFMRLTNTFRAGTLRAAREGRLFEADVAPSRGQGGSRYSD